MCGIFMQISSFCRFYHEPRRRGHPGHSFGDLRLSFEPHRSIRPVFPDLFEMGMLHCKGIISVLTSKVLRIYTLCDQKKKKEIVSVLSLDDVEIPVSKHQFIYGIEKEGETFWGHSPDKTTQLQNIDHRKKHLQ